MLFRACVWDLDGTLLNTLPTILHYCNQSLAHFGFHSIVMEDCRDLCRLLISHFYHRLLELGGCPPQDIERLQPAIRDYDCASYLSDFMYLTEPYEGVRETLKALQDMGVQNAVLTNKPDALAHSLIERFFGGLMQACIGQTPKTISKPDPRSMDRVLEALGVQRSEILYVGDTDVDMQTTHNTGTAAAAACWGYQSIEQLLPYKPAYIVHAPRDLVSIFRR